MKILLTMMLWALLLLLCWPLALLLLVAWPLLWLLSIPFRIVATAMEALLALVKAVLFLPARLLGVSRSEGLTEAELVGSSNLALDEESGQNVACRRMRLKPPVLLLAFIFVLAGASGQVSVFPDTIPLAKKAPGRDVHLGESKQAPKLRLAVTCPAGWTFEWTPSSPNVLGRFIRNGTRNREMLIVTAIALPPELAGKSSDEVLNERFLRDFAAPWDAALCRRVRDDKWDGVFMRYALPESMTKGKSVVDVEDWMLISDGYRVEFNCYFEKDMSLSSERRASELAELRARYHEVVKTVRKEPASR